MTGSRLESMQAGRQQSLGAGHIDWWTVLIYLALVVMGWLNIYSAVYNDAHPAIYDMSQRYGMQLIWIGIAVVMAVVVLLVDDKYWHMWAYPLYIAGILVLVAVLLFGREVNGAKAWIFVGGQGIQPTELVKFTTSLAVARFMSNYRFSIGRFRDIMEVCAFIILPVTIIFLQNDTGSAIVYGAFFFMLYREGLNGWLYVIMILAVVLFIASFLVTPVTILIALIIFCVVAESMKHGFWRDKVIYLSAVTLGAVLIYYGTNILLSAKLSFYVSLLISTGISIIGVVIYAFRRRLMSVFLYLALFVGALGYVNTVDYAFDNMLQIHQQKRILDLLGLESDTQNWGYNVNQSKIAIGSGGFFGKGYMEGTQTRYDFVPEQSTDFIFCTVGEEWGFVGSALVVTLFSLLILRLMKMGERQMEPFGRIYCYCVAAIFFAHVLINVGMTIGIMPVIGIPLPFFSYGGSSFLAFSLLFFVAVKLDMQKRELMRQ